MIRPFAVVALSVALAGCGGAAATSSSPTPNPGATYSRIVKPTNDAASALDTAIQVRPIDLPGIRKASGIYQVALHQFNTDLLDLKAQASKAAPDIDALRKSVAMEESLAGAVAISTDANMLSALTASNAYSDGGAATLVRSDLGLAPPPIIQASPSPSTHV